MRTYLDPRDPDGATSLEKVFQFDLDLAEGGPMASIGSRVHVRFVHPPEPLAWRWYRSLRRVFLSHFSV